MDGPPQEWLEKQIAAWLHNEACPLDFTTKEARNSWERRRAESLSRHLSTSWQAHCQAERDLAELQAAEAERKFGNADVAHNHRHGSGDNWNPTCADCAQPYGRHSGLDCPEGEIILPQESAAPRLVLRYVCIDPCEDGCQDNLAVSDLETYWDETKQEWLLHDGNAPYPPEITCSACTGPMRQEAVLPSDPGVPAAIEAQEQPHA